jgi:hypothetical protein
VRRAALDSDDGVEASADEERAHASPSDEGLA